MELEKMLSEVRGKLPRTYATELADRINNPKITANDIRMFFYGRSKRVDVFLAISEKAKEMVDDINKAKENLKSVTNAA